MSEKIQCRLCSLWLPPDMFWVASYKGADKRRTSCKNCKKARRKAVGQQTSPEVSTVKAVGIALVPAPTVPAPTVYTGMEAYCRLRPGNILVTSPRPNRSTPENRRILTCRTERKRMLVLVEGRKRAIQASTIMEMPSEYGIIEVVEVARVVEAIRDRAA